MLHTSFEVEVLLQVINYPNGFLEKKNFVKTRPGSDFSSMSYRKGEPNALCERAKNGIEEQRQCNRQKERDFETDGGIVTPIQGYKETQV